MTDFRFFHPIEVRYGDLDPQGVVNNAKYLTYFEQARVHYVVHLGLFSADQSFLEIGVIVADIHVAYRAPLVWGVPVKAGVRTARIGGKSMTVDQAVVHAESGQVYASGTVILVAYDYRHHKSIPVPKEWREKIGVFEGIN
ncbi:MAG TPA: thioesterase family protein [Anaerolineales bacterium]|jgi:acyl-CoA thioester hydrolase